MHTISQKTLLRVSLAKLEYLAARAVLVYTDLQVKQATAAALACLNVTFYASVTVDRLTTVMAQAQH
jgi:hypothetical protein